MSRIALIAGISPVSYLLSRGLIAFDGDAGAAVAAPPAGSGAPAASGSVAAASKAYLAGLSAEQREKPIAPPAERSDNIDDELEGNHVATPGAAAVDPAVAAAAAAASATTPAAEELVIAREDGAIWDVGAKRWQKADGTFAEGEAPTADELTALETAKAEAKAKVDASTAAAEKKKVVLKGLAERGESDLEIEIEDETAAERIRRLQREGLRREAFQELKTKVDEERAELNAVTAAIDADPVSFIVGQLTPERSLDVARALLAEHFDALIPMIQSFDDETAGHKARADARLALRDRVDQSRETITDTQQRQRHAAACMNAAQSLIPDGAEPDVVAAFMNDVEMDLVQAARSKQAVTPQTVPQLIERRLKLYGFGAGSTSAAAPAAPAAPAPAGAGTSSSSTARPVGEKAVAIAARVVTKEQARSAQSRIKTVQTSRQVAAAAAPPGAGAAPVQVPVIDPKADVRSASKQLRQQGAGWTRPG